MKIRSASPDDAAALLEIYRPYVEETAVTFDYEAPSPDEFRARITGLLEKYPYLVAEEDGVPVAYAYAGPLSRRAAYQWSAETSIYVRQDFRRKGCGRALYESLEEACRRGGIRNLYACVTFPTADDDEHISPDSIRFHESMGFRTIGHFTKCGLKFGRWYDVIWMEKLIGMHD